MPELSEKLRVGLDNTRAFLAIGVVAAGLAISGNAQAQQYDGNAYYNPSTGSYEQQASNPITRFFTFNKPNGGYYNQRPTAPVMYEGVTSKGLPYYVTVNDSPGLAAIEGKRQGSLSLDSDGLVKSAINRGADALAESYHALDEASKKYLSVAAGRTSAGKISRYAIDDAEVLAGSVVQKEMEAKINAAKREFDMAYNNYASRRSRFVNVADNAAIDGFNLEGYKDVLQYISPPESTTLTADGNRIPNKFERLSNARRI